MSESLSADYPKRTQADTPARQWLQRWRSGRAEDVRTFLASTEKLTAEQMVAVLLVEQRERWQRGERIFAETYLAWYPELQANAEAAVELIYGEFLLRAQSGETPLLADYQQRFPAYGAARTSRPATWPR